MNYILKYREPGKKPGTTRWAKRPVESTKAAIEWMNENPDKAFTPPRLDNIQDQPTNTAE